MKHYKVLFVFVLSLMFATVLSADQKPASRDVIEQSYIEGINSGNLGLKVSSAYHLGEMKSDAAVIPLMAMLRGDDCDGARLAAALALVKIGDSRGLYLVKRSIDFNDCEKVRKLAKHLYRAYITDGIVEAEKDVSFAVASLK